MQACFLRLDGDYGLMAPRGGRPHSSRHWQQKSSSTPSGSGVGALQLSEESSVSGLSPDSHLYPYDG
jgi:hypothetical protein